MMGEDEKQADSEPRPDDQLNVMQFNTVQDNTYGNQDKLYNYSINDFSYYLSSFYGNESSEKTFTDVASNVMQVMGTNPTWEQKIESEIVKIFKNNPQTGTMEHQKLTQFLKEELGKSGFINLDDVDILKHATLIRDPLTFEVNVPFETRPSRTNEMKDLAWKKDASRCN